MAAATVSWRAKIGANLGTFAAGATFFLLFMMLPLVKFGVFDAIPGLGNGPDVPFSVTPENPDPQPEGSSSGNPSPSKSADPKREFIDEAQGTSQGKQLADNGYTPMTVLQTAADNGQAAKYLDGLTARTGTYVVYRKDTTLVSTPSRDTIPDQLVMVKTGTPSDGKIVGYYQTFANGRAAVCGMDSKFDLGDKSNWYLVNMWLNGKSLETYHDITSADIPQIPSGTTLHCGASNPETSEMP